MKEATMQPIVNLVNAAFPHEEITQIHERGYWMNDEDYHRRHAQTGEVWRGRRVFTVQLRNGTKYCLKLANPNDEWEADFTSELTAYKLLSHTNLPIPRVIKVDLTQQLLGTNYIILSHVDGVKLCTLWLQSDEATKHALYRELGRVYRQMHQIKGTRSGLFKTVDDPYAVRFPVQPNEYMLDRELRNDSGLKAVQQHVIQESTYHTIIDLWEQHLDYLKDHTPTLIHYSAFCWTIGWAQTSSGWEVSRLTGCGDMTWWDPAIDLSLFKYSHFMSVQASHWEAFQEGYGLDVEPQRIALYGLFTKLLAAMGVYREPSYLRNPWLRETLEAELQAIIAEIL
jgi:hypothetical protein